MIYAAVPVVIVLIDQLVKAWTARTLPLHVDVSFLPHFLGFYYTQNTGAAWSVFSQHTWILTILSAGASVLLAVAVWKKFFRHPFGRMCLSLILAGAVGNLIDRALLGYVVDMFKFLFVTFPIFNVADMAITVGGVLLVIYVLFFYNKLEKKPEPKEETHDPSSDG